MQSLPDEILLIILTSLSPADLRHFMHTSKRHHQLALGHLTRQAKRCAKRAAPKLVVGAKRSRIVMGKLTRLVSPGLVLEAYRGRHGLEVDIRQGETQETEVVCSYGLNFTSLYDPKSFVYHSPRCHIEYENRTPRLILRRKGSEMRDSEFSFQEFAINDAQEGHTIQFPMFNEDRSEVEFDFWGSADSRRSANAELKDFVDLLKQNDMII